MGWLIATCVIFGVVFLIGFVLTVAHAMTEATETFDFLIMLCVGTFAAGVVATLLAAFPGAWAQTHYNERTISCHVTDKDRAGKKDGMRIYTSCGVFENTDSILRGKNTSADIFGRVQVGNTQTFHVVGWRFGLLSDFPNVLEVK